MVLLAVLTTLALLVAVGTTALARMGRPWGFHRGCHHGDHSPEAVRERAQWSADRALDRVDATDAQREQVNAIVGATVEDLSGLRSRHRNKVATHMAERVLMIDDDERLGDMLAEYLGRAGVELITRADVATGLRVGRISCGSESRPSLGLTSTGTN